MRELVLRDRGERQVLLDVRHPPRPLRMAVADDELVVGEREQQREPRVGVLESSSSSRDERVEGGAGPRTTKPRAASSRCTRFIFAPTPTYASCRR